MRQKKTLLKINLLIILTLSLFSLGEQVKAAGCGYICNYSPDVDTALEYCQKNSGSDAYLGTTLSLNGTPAACSAKANCAMNSVPVCCCTGATSILTPSTTTKTSCSWMDSQTINGKDTLNGNCPTGANPCNNTECVGTKDPKKSCCYKPITTALSAAEPKFKLPDYVFQIPIGKLSKLNTVDCSSGTCQIPFIAQYVSAVYEYGLSIAGVLGVLMLMAAGLLWMVSGGDSGKVTKAKQLIFGSVTGLLLLLGLSLFLGFINPDLIKTKTIDLESIQRKELEAQADEKLGNTAEEYKNKPCATSEELQAGIDFYATGYYKAPWQDNQTNYYLCDVAMQGTCPNGINNSGSCTENGKAIFPKYPNYKPCKTFSKEQYNSYFSASDLIVGKTVAGPRCSNLPKGTQICFKGKTYKITDSGGGIKGKRIDILSSSISDANKNSSTGVLSIVACK